MSKFLNINLILAFATLGWVGAVSANEAGESAFGQCRGCHSVGPDAKHQFGPVLNGVMGRSAQIADDYDYSSAFKKATEGGLEWTPDTMSDFLSSPLTYIAGTKMAFAGVQSEEDRKNIIEYLSLFDEQGNLAGAPVVDEQAVETSKAADQPRALASETVLPEHGELHLGRVALDEEIDAWDIDVRPDGIGLPVGRGDAIAGADLYDAQCASCHGDFGEGTGRWPILAGGHDTLTEDRPEKTIGSYWPYLSTVYDYIRRAMPFGNARSLSDDEVYAITAYILYLNDEVEEDFELTSENFLEIRLPNEENFVADNRGEEDFRQLSIDDVCMSDCALEPATVVQRAMVLDVTPDE